MKLAAGFLLLVFSIGLFVNVSGTASHAAGADSITPGPTPETAAAKTPPYSTYRGVTVGMAQAAAREKLGEASQRSNAGDYYAVSATESAQILWDKDQTVKSITVNYSGNLKMAPSTKDVVGEDIKKEADGSIYKLVRYPESGFWVSYNRTAGDDPTVVITLQKMAKQ
ncbi:MAG: hypothetical protein KA746_05690 [Pyrinomonadaceae bacterium]|nr:hypothetical protein [Pyrinomonadaceae bacterium]MBP6212608.1 hypothetical protein [Pyrinomonadaceae bacterium]